MLFSKTRIVLSRVTLAIVLLVFSSALLQAQNRPGESPFDLRIDSATFSPDPVAAGEQLQVDIFMGLGQTGVNPDGLEFVVEIYEGREATAPIASIPGEILGNDAIVCAVKCAGLCLSIFGDGVCTGCGCDYSLTLVGVVPTPRAEADYFLKIDTIEGEADKDPSNDTLVVSCIPPPPPPPFDLSILDVRFHAQADNGKQLQVDVGMGMGQTGALVTETGVGLDVVSFGPLVQGGHEDEAIVDTRWRFESDGTRQCVTEEVRMLADDHGRPRVLVGTRVPEVRTARRCIPTRRNRKPVR